MAQIIKLRFNDAQGVEQISFPISVPEAILFKAEGDKAQQNLNEVIAAINTSITNIATEIGNSEDAANKEGSIHAQINSLEQVIAEITGGDVNSIAAQIAAAIQGLGSASDGSLTAVTVGVDTDGKLTVSVNEEALIAELAKFDTTIGVTRGGLISTAEGYAVNADSTVKEAVDALDSKLKSDIAAVTEGYEAADEALQANIDTKIGKEDVMIDLSSRTRTEGEYLNGKLGWSLNAAQDFEFVAPYISLYHGQFNNVKATTRDDNYFDIFESPVISKECVIFSYSNGVATLFESDTEDGERSTVATRDLNQFKSQLVDFHILLTGEIELQNVVGYLVTSGGLNTKDSIEYLKNTKADKSELKAKAAEILSQVDQLDGSAVKGTDFNTTLGVNAGESITSADGTYNYLNAGSDVATALDTLDSALKGVEDKVDAINVGVTSFDGQEGAITIDNDATGIGNVKFECGDSKELKGTVDVGVKTFKLSSEQESVDNVVLYDVNDWAPEAGDASDYTNADVVFKHNEANDTIMGVAKIKNVNYEIKSVTPASANVKEEYEFQKDGVKVGDSIKIYKDASLKSVELVDADSEGNAGQFLKFTHILADGTESDTYFNVSRLLVEAEFKNGLQVNEAGEVSVKVDPASEEFLTVGADGVKLSGVQDAIDTVDGKLTEHKNNTVAHITAEERAAWNAKVDFDVLKSVNYELDLTIFE